MKKILQSLAVVSMSLIMTSCYYDAYLDIPDNGGPIPTDVSFQNEIQPIFTAKCAGCHDDSRDPDLRDGMAYAALSTGGYITPGNADTSELYNKLPGVGHPVNVGFNLSADELALIRAWIEEGAENN